MDFFLGVKSDPIEYRFSFSWLFSLMDRLDVRFVQIGSFMELYTVEDGYLYKLRELAERYNIRIKSCFSAHRELGGFFTGNRFLESAAKKNYERFIHVASVLGADYTGASPGAVYRDRPEYKQYGIECYFSHMKELMVLAKEKGLKALTMEPMSCSAEPPTTPEEITSMMRHLNDYHQLHPGTTVPVGLCGDVSHGYADRNCRVVHSNIELFSIEIPWLYEFHLKNTDSCFDSTFGFSRGECEKGIIDLNLIRSFLEEPNNPWPVEELVGYLEIGGPKLGRDYSDYQLEEMLESSLTTLTEELL